ADPVFSGTDVTNPLSYQLGSLSPCIDAGTQDTTGLYLPAFDLLGNPRIYNNRIDIGCFEWDGTPNQEQHLPVSTSCLSIGIFPNPLRGAGTICVNLPHKGKTRVEIYNIKGQRIREYDIGEKPAGFHTVFWDGMDINKRQVSTGTYLLKLSQGTQTVTRKIILLK
ncbi:MAG: T9SS type A sorting domain-containing protein, partial [Candidatus Cloacimonetes bacterium]|nr:T9SS type A sorting domain-containing protein [Candidatus Cloacimonadota bacterium]